MERALYEERNMLKTTLLSIGDGVISTDGEGKVKIINKVAEKLTGWLKEEAQGLPLDEVFNIINEKTRQKQENPVIKVLESGKIIELANHTSLISKNGTEIAIEDSAAPIINNDGKISGVVLVFRDFTDKKKKREIVEYFSFHDYLTGLFNRAYYEKELQRLQAEEFMPVSVIMADVNGLKLTNDAFGHAKGDELLKSFSRVLKNLCCQDKLIVSRTGGDEFIILMPLCDKDKAEQLIEELNKRISEVTLENVVLSVSFGYDTCKDVDTPLSLTAKNAEDNMYANKLTESTSMRNKTISIIMKTLYEKNKVEEEHSKRVSVLVREIAEAMDFSGYEVHEIEIAGLMHDIGKIGIDIDILNKPGILSEAEYEEIKKHSEVGYRILSSVNDFSRIADIILYHHERWDGKGYPKGLKGEDIPLKARIIMVADAYDAMISERAYRKPLPKELAIDELKKMSGIQFDEKITRIFIEKVLNEKWD